ncbi:MAG: hypothetical protein MI974_05635 [Chitinophagales bacterium]|nr:hypothetical protein [Chitinophagales bacterium]
MKRTLFFVLIILGLFSCEKKEIQKVPTEVSSIEFRDGEEESLVSAEITEYQLLGEPNDYAHIEFFVEDTDEEEINFELYIESNYDFLGSFFVNEEDEDDWDISSFESIGDNNFIIQLQNLPSTSTIVQEEIICMRPPDKCGDCDKPHPVDCVDLFINDL